MEHALDPHTECDPGHFCDFEDPGAAVDRDLTTEGDVEDSLIERVLVAEGNDRGIGVESELPDMEGL